MPTPPGAPRPVPPESGGPPRRSRAPGMGAMQEAGPYMGLGLQVAGGLLFFVGLGYFADGYLGTTPWGMVVGAVLGMVGVIALLVRVSNEASAQAKARKREPEA